MNSEISLYRCRAGAPLDEERFAFFGIGNPGQDYLGTRHNIGFEVLDKLARRINVAQQFAACNAQIVCGTLNPNHDVVLVKPQTFVNRSGESYAEFLSVSAVPAQRCMVIVDDFNLPLGTLRIRSGGSAGGHNGLKSIVNAVGTEFPRLRFGIGPLPLNTTVVDFVLGRFNDQELSVVEQSVASAVDASLFVVRHGVYAAMNEYNK
jgi:PTH1 family peptidyl-tRNA hydrolase